MPSKVKKLDRAVAKLPSIPKDLVNQFLTDPMTEEAINAAGFAFKQALIEAPLNAELSHHLGYPPGAAKPEAATNHRNGGTSKTVLTGDGKLRIETPRDRDGSFEPVLLPKHARRFTAFDDSIVALYARGMTVREIQGYLAEAYGTEVSPDLISTVTDGVLAEVTAWQSRPLEPVYPVVFFDALRVKTREDNVVRNKAVYLALGVRRDGTREVLGLWIEITEGAKFWMKVFNDLKTRGGFATEFWVLPHFPCWACRRHAAWRTRARRSSIPARPYIVRFSIFRRLFCPSTGLVVHGCVSAALTASKSRRSPAAKLASKVPSAAWSSSLRFSLTRWQSIAFNCLAHLMATPSVGSSVSSRTTNRSSGSDNVALLAISTRASFLPVGACQFGAAELIEVAVSGSIRRRPPAQHWTMFWRPLKPSATNSRQSWAALRHPSAQRRCTMSM